MPKQIVKNVASQIGQLAGETFETIKKQPQEMAGKVLEQMGVSAGNPQASNSTSEVKSANTSEVSVSAKIQLEQRKAQEAAQSQQAAAQISHQIEQEIDQLRKNREEQLRQRRQSFDSAQDRPVASQEEAPIMPASKPGRQFGGGRRVKSAQEMSRPETAGRRVGG